MTAVLRDLYVEQGATYASGFVWAELDEEGNVGTPVDISGAEVRMQFRKSRTAPVALDARNTGSTPAIWTDGPAGRIDIQLSDELTDQLTSRAYKYDLEVEFPDGRVVRLLEGSVTVSPNITREEP